MFRKRFVSAAIAAAMVMSLSACGKKQPETTPSDRIQGYSRYSDSSNLYTHMNDTSKAGTLEGMTLEGYELIGENQQLALYLREESASIRVVDKKSGYIWGALRQDKPDDLNKTWSAFANSIVSIMYYDEMGSTAKTGAGHQDNQCTFQKIENGVTVHVDFIEKDKSTKKESSISLSASVQLVDDHVRFSLDDSSIKENGDNRLGQVYFAPFLGSTVGDEISGYMFVPDGSGALIRFQRPIKYLTGYSDRIYGSDYSIDNTYTVGDLNANRTNDFLKSSETVTMPVYGISHGYDSNALFGYVESGAEYAVVMAEPAGIVTDYNYATTYFLYRQAYMQPTERDGSGVQIVQEKPNTVNPALSIYFLNGEDANYTGMAHCYRNILQEQGILPGAGLSDPKLMIDFIVADICEGFLVNTTTSLTDTEQLLVAAEYLQQQGITDASFQLMGWQKGGLNGYNKLDTYTATEFGMLREVSQLQQTLSAKGYDLSMYFAPFSAKQGQISSQKDYAIALSQEIIGISRNNKAIFLGDVQYIKAETALQILEAQIDILRQEGLDSFAVDEAAELLYSEMLMGEESVRTQVLEMIQQRLTSLAGEEGLTLYTPNAYAFDLTSVYRDAPMSASRYSFETDSIPFLQIVLSGSMTMYAPYANQSFYTDLDVLKCIEYNAYPSFLLTGSDSSLLSGTPSQEFFSTSFEDWKVTAVSIYQQIDQVLSNVQGQKMQSHRVLQEGIVQVVYETGSIYVNYTDTQVLVNGVTVPAIGAVYTAN